MNKEIKEILDYFQKDVDKYEESKRYLMQKYGYDEENTMLGYSGQIRIGGGDNE